MNAGWLKLIANARPLRVQATAGPDLVSLPPVNTCGRRAAKRLARALAGEFTKTRRPTAA